MSIKIRILTQATRPLHESIKTSSSWKILATGLVTIIGANISKLSYK
jgi:hypothetical protein